MLDAPFAGGDDGVLEVAVDDVAAVVADRKDRDGLSVEPLGTLERGDDLLHRMRDGLALVVVERRTRGDRGPGLVEPAAPEMFLGLHVRGVQDEFDRSAGAGGRGADGSVEQHVRGLERSDFDKRLFVEQAAVPFVEGHLLEHFGPHRILLALDVGLAGVGRGDLESGGRGLALVAGERQDRDGGRGRDRGDPESGGHVGHGFGDRLPLGRRERLPGGRNGLFDGHAAGKALGEDAAPEDALGLHVGGVQFVFDRNVVRSGGHVANAAVDEDVGGGKRPDLGQEPFGDERGIVLVLAELVHERLPGRIEIAFGAALAGLDELGLDAAREGAAAVAGDREHCDGPRIGQVEPAEGCGDIGHGCLDRAEFVRVEGGVRREGGLEECGGGERDREEGWLLHVLFPRCFGGKELLISG